MRISQEPEESKPEMTPLKGNETIIRQFHVLELCRNKCIAVKIKARLGNLSRYLKLHKQT